MTKRGEDGGPSEPHSHALAAEDVLRVKVKAELRKRLRGVRKTMPPEAALERSTKIIATLETHPAIIAAKRVALFWPIEARKEVDLRALDRSLRTRGVSIAYPAIDTDTNEMTLRLAGGDELEERGFGFAEPSADAPDAAPLDVIIVPAIALDPSGHRIGYGAGYYDRTLPKYAPPAVTIGVAYDWQLVAEVPFTEHDVRVQWVVTDTRTLEVA